jgi:hypothetical protein
MGVICAMDGLAIHDALQHLPGLAGTTLRRGTPVQATMVRIESDFID